MRTVLNVAIIPDDSLKALSSIKGIRYRQVALHDSRNIPRNKIRKLARWVTKRMKKGRVMIHCDSGCNRSALIAVLAILKYDDEHDAKKVIDQARGVRPSILRNKHFEKFVLKHGSRMWEDS